MVLSVGTRVAAQERERVCRGRRIADGGGRRSAGGGEWRSANCERWRAAKRESRAVEGGARWSVLCGNGRGFDLEVDESDMWGRSEANPGQTN
jgi:hypothetical protein